MKTRRVRANDVASWREATIERRVCREVRSSWLHLFERSGHAERIGSTLTEVLVSLMIMSIGIVGVATLFPIAALRTLEANKQTNSTIARFTSEALVDVDPQFVHNPDGFWPPAAATDMTPYNGNTFRGQNYLVDPMGWQAFNYDPTTPTDPLPASPVIAPFPTGVSPRDYFGNSPAAPVNLPLPRRYTGASMLMTPYPTTAAELVAARIQAAGLVAQPDSWKLVVESQIVGATPATGIIAVALDNDSDLSSINVTPGVTYRAIIYDIDGTHSETRNLVANPTGFGVSWVDPLPSRFESSPATGATPNVGKVRIEVYDQVYSWMLTVRKRPSGPASVDVVVFYKRNFDPNFERVYDGEFRVWNLGPNGVPGNVGDDNGINGAEDVAEVGYPGSDDFRNYIVTVKVPSATLDDERPKLKRGGYVFDTKNGLWYRIRAVQNQLYGMGAAANEDWVDVVLDETIRLDSTEDIDGSGTLNLTGEDRNGNGVLDRGGVIVHPNVVNVFPLEIKEP